MLFHDGMSEGMSLNVLLSLVCLSLLLCVCMSGLCEGESYFGGVFDYVCGSSRKNGFQESWLHGNGGAGHGGASESSKTQFA